MIKIAHIDIDQFYVAVERLKDPGLIGVPVVVGGSPRGRGVVSSASYEARKFGIHSAMPMYQAYKLCPHLIRSNSAFGEYTKYSKSVFGIVSEYSSTVERTSIDEGYFDLEDAAKKLQRSGIETAEEIRTRIWKDIGLSVSIGIGTNKMMAKIASKKAKPKGILEIFSSKEKNFLEPLKVDVIPGIGPKTREKLMMLGVISIKDLRTLSEKELKSRFGVHGEALFKRARGYASTNLIVKHERKSISKERTFKKDISDPGSLAPTIEKLTKGICLVMNDKGVIAKGISIKMRYENFETLTRSRTLIRESCDEKIIREISEQMIFSNFQLGRSVRLIGIKVYNFKPVNIQTELFSSSSFG